MIIVTERGGCDVQVTGTKQDLDDQLVKVGLVGPDEKTQFATPNEFYSANNIDVSMIVPTMKVVSVEELVKDWV